MQAQPTVLEAALTSDRLAELPRDVHRLIAPFVEVTHCAYLASSDGTAETAEIQVEAYAVPDGSVRRLDPFVRLDCNLSSSRFLTFKGSKPRIYDTYNRGGLYPHGLPLDDEWSGATMIGRQVKYISLASTTNGVIFDTKIRKNYYRRKHNSTLYAIDKLDDTWIVMLGGQIQSGFDLDDMSVLSEWADHHSYESVNWLSEWLYIVGFERRFNHRIKTFIADSRVVFRETIIGDLSLGMPAGKRITVRDGRIFSGSHVFSIDEYDLRASRWVSWCRTPDRFVTDVAFAESADGPPARSGGPCREGQLPR